MTAVFDPSEPLDYVWYVTASLTQSTFVVQPFGTAGTTQDVRPIADPKPAHQDDGAVSPPSLALALVGTAPSSQ